MNYYNEWDKHAAQWLRELIKAGLIPPGDVDERSITEIKPHELTKYTQCHFFAGIGGWSLALRLAGWSDSRPVGTGSCPCQPFSTAGKQLGNADERHLWPAFFRLIVACRALGQRWTDSIFGEQVEVAINHGWLDSISADLEGEGYAVGQAILGAHSVGAPHRRQRLYWVAYAKSQREDSVTGGAREGIIQSDGDSKNGSLDNANSARLNRPEPDAEGASRDETRVRVPSDGQPDSPLEHSASDGREQRRPESSGRGVIGGRSNGVALGDTDDTGPQGRGLRPDDNAGSWAAWSAGVEFIACTDGRKRLVKPGIFPLAHGFPGRVGLLRGSGNAIVPQVAARFIQAAEGAVT